MQEQWLNGTEHVEELSSWWIPFPDIPFLPKSLPNLPLYQITGIPPFMPLLFCLGEKWTPNPPFVDCIILLQGQTLKWCETLSRNSENQSPWWFVKTWHHCQPSSPPSPSLPISCQLPGYAQQTHWTNSRMETTFTQEYKYSLLIASSHIKSKVLESSNSLNRSKKPSGKQFPSSSEGCHSTGGGPQWKRPFLKP